MTYNKIPVLDHGYVQFVEAWGHGLPGIEKSMEKFADGTYSCEITMEAGIIEAARQSTQGSFRGWDTDAKLLKFLYSHKHFTPFEFSGMTIEVQAPIFVFREWQRHRTQSYNEMSARYAPLPDLYYRPDRVRIVGNVIQPNKQASSTTIPAGKHEADAFVAELHDAYINCERVYQEALAHGIPKELARLVMPVGHYSRMRASANLRNWLAFCTLRCDDSAQWEIRQFALAVAETIKQTFPQTFALWNQTNE